MFNNLKPISPIGPGGRNGGGNSVNTHTTVSTPTAFPNSALLAHLQARVDALEGRVVALEATTRHQQVLIGLLQQQVYSR